MKEGERGEGRREKKKKRKRAQRMTKGKEINYII